MQPLLFHEATSVSTIALTPKLFSSPACGHAYDAFGENMRRTLSVLAVPGWAYWTGGIWHTALSAASAEILGASHVGEPTPEQLQAIGGKTQHNFAAQMMKNWQMQDEVVPALTQNFESFAGTTLLRSALEGMLKGVLVQTWMSFEVMAGDLWEWVLNEHPSQLASLAGKPRNKAREEAASAEQKPDGSRDRGKMIPLSYLERNAYDLSRLMGTILRKEKCEFTKLSGIREAYLLAFSKDYAEIADILNDPALDASAQIRHVLVHKGGRVDQEFWSAAQRFPLLARFKDLEIGEHLFVDGTLVSQITPHVLEIGRRLIEAVCAWTERNSPKDLKPSESEAAEVFP